MEADFAGLDRRALQPDAEGGRGQHVRHVLCVVVAAVSGVEVAMEAVLFAGERKDVAVVDVALGAVDDDAERLAHRGGLEDLAREAGPIGRDRLATNDVRVGLEVDEADGLSALTVEASDLCGKPLRTTFQR